jgi:hypothetical protein
MTTNTHSVLILMACMLTGCATPPTVKEALVSVDQAYVDNAKLIDQYQVLVSQINERYEKWFRVVKNRALLGLALNWATTDPVANESDATKAKTVDEVVDQLGPALVKIVNEFRLAGLPPQVGIKHSGFRSGAASTSQIIVGLPKLVHAIEDRNAEVYEAVVDNNMDGFAAYKKNLAVLARANSTAKRYLDIDVTIKPEDVNEIVKGLKQLQ